MPKTQLTNAFCVTAYCPPGKAKENYYDTVTSGFVLEVRSSGGKTYALRYLDAHNRQRQHKIGVFGDISFEQARKEAKRLRSQVTLGGNPAAAKEELRAVPTYAELATQHLAHAKTYQRSYGTTECIVRLHILPRWGKVRLTDIRQQEVAQWLAEKAAGGLAPATVEKVRVTFGRSFSLALTWGTPGVTRNPIVGIRRPPINNARERFLTIEEARRLQRAVANSRNTLLPSIVGLLLLTGARVSELLKAEWAHIDLDRRAWLIPTSKTGKSRHVPLSQAAIDIIVRLHRVGRCPYLLPNPDTLKPFTTIKHGWQKARRDARLDDLRIHDLRHSAASFMLNGGIDLFTIGKVLGHSSYQSTQRYSHLANETLLAAVEASSSKQQIDWSQTT